MLGYEFLSMLSGCVAGELFGRLPVPIDVLPRRVTTDQKVQPCSRDAFIRNGWSASAATDSVVHGPDCFFHPSWCRICVTTLIRFDKCRHTPMSAMCIYARAVFVRHHQTNTFSKLNPNWPGLPPHDRTETTALGLDCVTNSVSAQQAISDRQRRQDWLPWDGSCSFRLSCSSGLALYVMDNSLYDKR